MKKKLPSKGKLTLDKTAVRDLTVRTGVRAGERCDKNTCWNCGRSSMISRSV